ncbi:MAG: hypothetical protein H0U92_13055 [Actinobacteria bacterium]|nr:hypothetical protein [Actinomycetota bacterium]
MIDTDRPLVDNPRIFWPAVAIGGLIVAFGVRGLLVDAVPPVGYLKWFLGVNLAHDLILVPAGTLIVVAARRLPARIRAVILTGLFAATVLTIYAFPFLLGRGRRKDSPSVLPLDYSTGLGWALLAVGLATGVGIAWQLVRPREHKSGATGVGTRG